MRTVSGALALCALPLAAQYSVVDLNPTPSISVRPAGIEWGQFVGAGGVLCDVERRVDRRVTQPRWWAVRRTVFVVMTNPQNVMVRSSLGGSDNKSATGFEQP